MAKLFVPAFKVSVALPTLPWLASSHANLLVIIFTQAVLVQASLLLLICLPCIEGPLATCLQGKCFFVFATYLKNHFFHGVFPFSSEMLVDVLCNRTLPLTPSPLSGSSPFSNGTLLDSDGFQIRKFIRLIKKYTGSQTLECNKIIWKAFKNTDMWAWLPVSNSVLCTTQTLVLETSVKTPLV